MALNGCIGCNKFVYLPSDKRTSCPYVKENGEVCAEPRYGANGQPKEVCNCLLCMHETLELTYFLFIQRVFYFPLKPKLSALLKIKKYYKMCQHEYTRPRNACRSDH